MPNSLDPVPDPWAELARAAKAGDARSAEALIVAAGPSLLRVVRRILGVRHPEVEDVVQEAAFAVLDALQEFRGECSLSHFIWRVAALTAMNARRRLRVRERVAPDGTEPDQFPSESPSPQGEVEAARQREILRQLLDELPAVQAEVLALHCVLGFTVAETAEAMAVPPNTVRSRLLAAKAALRKRITDDHGLFEAVGGRP